MPRGSPAVKLAITVDRDVHAKILSAVEAEGSSISAWITAAARQAMREAEEDDAGLNGWDAGPIENSVVVEGLASVLININKRYGSTHAGIRITGAYKK